MRYSVTPIREAGLEAKWGRTRYGGPILLARDPKSTSPTWFAVDKNMWQRAKTVGIATAFSEHTALGDIFSVAL
jgi:hypothetical protein